MPTTVPLGALTPTTTTTTTLPPTTTTTTTTTEPPTTTTTTVPRAAAPSTVAAPPAEAAGVTALQGCIASFAPPSSTEHLTSPAARAAEPRQRARQKPVAAMMEPLRWLPAMEPSFGASP